MVYTDTTPPTPRGPECRSGYPGLFLISNPVCYRVVYRVFFAPAWVVVLFWICRTKHPRAVRLSLIYDVPALVTRRTQGPEERSPLGTARLGTCTPHEGNTGNDVS